jgi:DNA mismatch repair ATPase MutS
MDIYHNNILKYKTSILSLDKVLNELSLWRLFTFILSAILIVVLANERLLSLVFMAVPVCVIAFASLVNRYNKHERLRHHTDLLKQINEHEVLRLDNKLSGFSPGEIFSDPRHPYVADLDVFGSHSIFQLINRTTTEPGYSQLGDWLSTPASNETILRRQQAVSELSPKLEWRQHFQASGLGFKHTKDDYDELLACLEKPGQFLHHKLKYLAAVIPLSILSTWATINFLIEFLLHNNFKSFVPLLIICLFNALILKKVKPVAEEITGNILQNIKVLGGYRSLILTIEQEKFNSALLQQLQLSIHEGNYSAVNEINKLKKVFELFQLRGKKRELNNFFYSLFNVLWFLDVYLVIQTEQWKKKNGSRLRSWASAVGEFEVLSSIAGFHYSNPSYTFPELNHERYNISFEKLGHPLIGQEKRIHNDFDLHGQGKITMITGSNMAGKSTFLRTMGVNMVLALMGAPCCARSAKVSNMNIFSSMRTQDSLEEGVSSFYAELKRIEQLLTLIARGEAVFFLLDEMFKGTNSKDRHKGGFSLIKQLEELNAFGIISTHDLELASLAGKHKLVANYSFNSRIEDGELIFDYVLTDGLCKDFNASELMKRSGIKILSGIEEL